VEERLHNADGRRGGEGEDEDADQGGPFRAAAGGGWRGLGSGPQVERSAGSGWDAGSGWGAEFGWNAEFGWDAGPGWDTGAPR